jgi:hypothetical protein
MLFAFVSTQANYFRLSAKVKSTELPSKNIVPKKTQPDKLVMLSNNYFVVKCSISETSAGITATTRILVESRPLIQIVLQPMSSST